jgi:poly(ADP-ribose) glycohydrolase ARH3
VPAAVFAALQFYDDFEEAVVNAVHLGGDTDTIGAMAGAIAGAHHGYEQFPRKFVKPLENFEKGRDYVLELAENLYQLYCKQFAE